jgi:hypothetical protein
MTLNLNHAARFGLAAASIPQIIFQCLLIRWLNKAKPDRPHNTTKENSGFPVFNNPNMPQPIAMTVNGSMGKDRKSFAITYPALYSVFIPHRSSSISVVYRGAADTVQVFDKWSRRGTDDNCKNNSCAYGRSRETLYKHIRNLPVQNPNELHDDGDRLDPSGAVVPLAPLQNANDSWSHPPLLPT